MTDEFEDLFRHAPFGYLATTIDDAIVRVNDTLLTWLGTDQDAVAGRAFGSLLEPGSRLFYETRHRSTLLMNGRIDEVSLTLVHRDGSRVPVLANATVVRDAAGEPTSVRIALADTTQRHDWERSLLEARRVSEASEARLHVLQRSAAAFISATTELELSERLVVAVRDAFDASTSSVLIADESGGLLTVAGEHREPAPGGPVRTAYESASPVVVADLVEAERSYPDFVEPMRDARVEALAAVPLIDGEVVLGVLVCTFGRSRAFDDDAVALLSALALQGTQVLRRLLLQAELRRLALHDPLTGLGNRQLLHEHAEQARLGVARSGLPVALIFFDLDGFKQINDTEGHAAGDAVLAEVAVRLRHAVRASDFSARYGGDEFVVVCEDADAEGASLVAERVRSAIAKPLASTTLAVTASIGVAVLRAMSAAATTTDELIEKADAAMYTSKNAGRNRVTLVEV